MKRILKIAGWTLLAVVLIILLAITIVVWYLTPAKLTPIVEREATALIDGEVKAERVELTFWSTFPQLKLDIDSLRVISNATHSLPDSVRREFPANADSLLSVGYIHGGIDLLSLVTGRIELYDVTIGRLKANIVNGRNGSSNLNIFKPTAEEKDSTETPGQLPDIAFDRFRLVDAGPITYTSIPDSIYLAMRLGNINLNGSGQPIYSLEIDGNASSPLLDDLALTPLTVNLDGRIVWNLSTPAAVDLDNLDIAVNEFAARVSATVDATQSIKIERLDIDIDTLDVAAVVSHLPAAMREKLKGLDTDMALSVSAKLTKPYTVADSLTMPSCKLSLGIEPCHLHLGNINMDFVNIEALASIDGDSLDRSELDINRLILNGRALDADISGKVTGPINDPCVDARLAAALRLHNLPRELLSKLPVELRGHLGANTRMKFRTGDFNASRFHNIYLDGNMTLRDFNMMTRDSLVNAWAENARLDFGTSRTVRGLENSVDSMLTVSLRVDTTSVELPGLRINGSDLLAALGSQNRSTSIDTTSINPFGGIIRMGALTLEQPKDSLTVRLRDMETKAALTRYQGGRRAPQMHFDLEARRIGTRMPGFGLAISRPEIAINAHLLPGDSVERADSLRRAQHLNRRRPRGTDSLSHAEVVDWNVSNDLKTLLRRWDVDGHLRSERAFIFTRSFPLRQRAADIDLHFNTDSIKLNSMSYSIGNTRLDVHGTVSNMERAFAGRSGRAKLKIDFDIDAPFIDINQLATTTFYTPSGEAGPDPDYDEEIIYEQPTQADSTAPRPVLIPRNINAHLAVNADSVLYSDLLMHGLHGDILINNSAVNLRDLRASTEIGTASLSALYWAPDTTHMQFGMGMQLNRFHIDRVLSLIPAVDSLLPALQGFAGVINADLAATANITPQMDFDMPSFKAALKLDGDSLVLLDADTFKMLAKWLIFKNKKRNMIDRMSVEIVVDSNEVEIFPFIFDIDRYKLGVMGRNDLDMNLDYHVSVLKSPLPFKFGINIKGNIDDPKIRLGGAKIKPGQASTFAIADTTRISLLNQIEEVFRRGSMSSESMSMRRTRHLTERDLSADSTLTAGDSLLMQREGFLPPDSVPAAPEQPALKKKKLFPWTRK